MPNANFIESIKEARRKGVPVVLVETVDSIATVHRIAAALNPKTPLIPFDCLRGAYPFRASNAENGEQPTVDELAFALPGIDADGFGGSGPNPVKALDWALGLPGKNPDSTGLGTVFFMHNAHEFLSAHAETRAGFAQAILNLRDHFASTGRTLILLGPAFDVPAQLAQHVMIVDEPLPTPEELLAIVREICADANVTLDNEGEQRAVQALMGLADFAARQSLSLAVDLSTRTLDFARLWDRKRKWINDTPGLSVWEGGQTFADVRGCEALIEYCKGVLNGKRRPGAIVIIDEGGDQMGSAEHDTSKVARTMRGKFLSEFQNKNYRGKILFGAPGCGKTLVGKAMAGEAGLPCIILDMGDVQNSLVGESEARLVQVFKIIDAVSGGNAYFIMTSNDLDCLPPQLKDRFRTTWMYDVPGDDRVKDLFQFFVKRKELTPEQCDLDAINVSGYTGRQVEQICDTAWEFDWTVSKAARSVRPFAMRDRAMLSTIRAQGDGRYLDVESGTTYFAPDSNEAPRGVAAAASTGGVFSQEA